jgi:hypothetical protein
MQVSGGQRIGTEPAGDLARLVVASGLQLCERPVDHPWPFCVSKRPLQIWPDRGRFLREVARSGCQFSAESDLASGK